jgi:hypothetical protein
MVFYLIIIVGTWEYTNFGGIRGGKVHRTKLLVTQIQGRGKSCDLMYENTPTAKRKNCNPVRKYSGAP